MEASKGVTEGTDAEYKRLMNSCLVFAVGTRLLGTDEECFSKRPQPNAPWIIIAWIMNVCDSLNLDGSPKPSTKDQGTYGHAQKMLHGLGNMHWHESDAGDGTMVGNPSILVEVLSFMCSLWRHKVQAGEVANSARAITSEILFKLHNHNHLPENWTIQAAYTVAFLCMLRFDEFLKIQVHDLRVEKDRVVLYLPFQKTHQNGDIKPFHLWVLPLDEAHICPARALAAWLRESKLTSGYLFRKVASGNCIAEANSPMVYYYCIPRWK
ncbi:hypothetical protein BDR07DRAFT_1483459 [Suillus spraguei]|nr:hypothetical protein BDR07DRAFT_1483459 [Suillus spraguei]